MRLAQLPWIALIGLLIFCNSPVKGHDGHDPVLLELNDYLMAIQLLRIEDERAKAIFATWDELRLASWEIRRLTDEENLLINADEVIEQIGKTKAKQRQLLQECRDYFSSLVKREPGIQVISNRSLKVNWVEKPIEVQVQHFQVILIEVQNQGSAVTEFNLKADRSDEILFWNKKFRLEPNTSRYTFVVLAPLKEGLTKNRLHIRDDYGNLATTKVQLQGVPMKEAPFNLLPAESVTKVTVPSEEEIFPKEELSFSSSIQFSVKDKLTNQPLAARVEVSDEEGRAYWSPLKGPAYAVNRTFQGGWKTVLWDFQAGPYFYLNGTAELGVDPRGKTAKIYHGFEYLPAEVAVPDNGKVEIALERWIDMPKRGWYAGQTHIHTTDLGIPVRFSPFWPIISQAEDLHVSAILTLKGEWESHAIYANEYPMGKREAFSTKEHIITYGEEFRNNPYGHLAFLGLKSLIQPISTGALGELGGPDYPPNAFFLDEAIAQGATTIGAHFGLFRVGIDQIQTPWPSTGFEMPVDIALGKIHLAEMAGNGGQLSVWYDLLNCGFRIAATAGPDWFIKDTPRIYVNLEGKEFNLDNWRQALQAGRSFYTSGPMLFFKVNGELPGTTLYVENKPTTFEIEAEALLPETDLPIEIIYNGEVIQSGSNLKTLITLTDSGWLAARCDGAHTNPVYINFDGRPAGYAEPAKQFISVIDRLSKWVEEKGLFYEERQKEEVLTILSQGRTVYESIIKRAHTLGRK